jgi:hypothetical protein
VLNSERASKSEVRAPSWERQAMLEYLQDAAIGNAGAVSARKVLAPTVVKMSGSDLADFEADRRQQVLHDRIAELRARAHNGGR